MALIYGAETTIDISPASVTDGTGRESAVATNPGYDDILVFGTCRVTGGSPTGFKVVSVYAYATVGGTTYPDNVTGANAGITLQNPTQLRPIGTIAMTSDGSVFKAGPWSVRAAFGGTLPQKWGIVVVNNTGRTFTATAGDHVWSYQGVTGT